MSDQYRGLSRAIVEKISQRKNDPEWMRELRLAALDVYNGMPMPKFGPDLSELDLDNIEI